MPKPLSCAAAALVCALPLLALAAKTQPPVTVKVLALNDFHGQLASPGSFRARAADPLVPAGGADMLAAYVARARAAQPNTVVVSAGDLVGASPLASALFHDEPTIEVMNRIGLDFNAVGNHEFDDGKAELRRLQRGGCHPTDGTNSCRGAEVGTPVPFEGARFNFLAANVVQGRNGDTLFPAYGIKTFGQGARRVKVAFIGMTLKDTPQIVSPSGVRGLQFLDEVQTVNALVPRLRAAGVESVVVLIHQGGVQTGTAADINACEGGLAGSPIPAIVAGLDNAVDLVITGHSHAAYNCRLPLASGRAIPVTSASSTGRVLSDIDLRIDPVSGDVLGVDVVNRVVDRSLPDLPPDAGVAALTAAYQRLAAPVANSVIGQIARDVPNSKDAACNMPAGELVADAQWAATAAAERGGAQFALMNPGGVRSPGFLYTASGAGDADGEVTYGEAFTVQPFGNALVTLTLTGQQLKDTLEQQFPNCFGQTTFARVLLPSRQLRYQWDHGQACGAKVRQVTVSLPEGEVLVVDGDGRVLEPARAWRVTVNNFLADGGDAFSVLRGGTDRLGGGQDIDALSAYLANYRAPQPPYDPQAPGQGRPRITRLDGGLSCP